MSIPIKTPDEIESMRRSCRAAREILEEVSLAVVPGVSTGEIDKLAAQLIKERGGRSPFLNYRGFPGHICISVNDEIVHGIGGARRIQYADIVKLDIGIILHGWVGDTATTIAVGEIPAATTRLLEKTQEALAIGIEQARPGNRVHHISEAIETFVVSNGYSVVREFVGHGVGRALHEEPHVPNYGREIKAKLKPGMTIAIEPMVNMGRAQVRQLADGWTVVTADGKPSAHFEHTVLITEDGPEILTCLPEKAALKDKRPMSSRDNIKVKATVTEVLREGAYRVELANGHRCIARASGELRLSFVRLSPGDRVQIEFHPYDLSRGRIVQ